MVIIYKCRTCKKQKDESSFGLYSGRLRKNCNNCRTWLQEYNKKNREHLLEMRRFRYHSDPNRTVAKQNAEYIKKQRANPIRKRQMMGNHIKRKYGLSLEQYDSLIKQQQNKCAICKETFPESYKMWNRPCVDHCHRTNKVRGILCRWCNISLHYIENFKFDVAAREYLRVSEAKDKEPLI
jgi:hypothetical protein